MPALDCCPTCGAKLADDVSYDPENRVFIANGISVRFSPGHGEIVNALWRARHRGAIESLERLAAMAWADRLDGGPDNFNSVSVQLVSIRKKMETAGYTVTRNMGQPKRGYRLAKAEDGHA